MRQRNQLDLFKEPEPDPFAKEKAIHFLALIEIPGIGFATARSLFEVFNGDFTKVWSTDADELHEFLRRAKTPQPTEVIRHIQKRSKELIDRARERYHFLQVRRNVSILFRGTPSFPARLNDLPNPPAWLFVEGDPNALLNKNLVAVVGTRTPSEMGIEAAKRLSVLLVRIGAVILSGLAEGIDAVGHQTAVDYGATTVSVLGHGIDVVFPAATSGLRRHIADTGGAVISEYLPRDTYTAERFVQRNRIQAALAEAVGIVEGRLKSGTAHTVRFARQLYRPIFGARIGPPSNAPQQELLEDLIKSGAPVFDLNSALLHKAGRRQCWYS